MTVPNPRFKRTINIQIVTIYCELILALFRYLGFFPENFGANITWILLLVLPVIIGIISFIIGAICLLKGLLSRGQKDKNVIKAGSIIFVLSLLIFIVTGLLAAYQPAQNLSW